MILIHYSELTMTTYAIYRHFMNHPKQFIKGGLTLEEVKEHCSDPETSSKTCTNAEGIRLAEEKGPWFDGFDEE